MTARGTLLELLGERAARDPGAEALRFGERPLTFGALWAGIERCAAHLLLAGVSPGERVVLAIPNGPRFFSTFYGVQRAGGVPVPAFPRSGPERLASLAGRCGARRILVEETPSAPGEATVSGGCELMAVAALEREVATDAFPPLAADDLAYIQFTSGSTGESKGVALSHRNVLANIGQLIAGFEATGRDVFVSWLPAYHDMGLVLMTMVPFALGARLVLLPATLRSLGPWLEAIQEHAGTFTAAPDFAYRMALRLLRNRELSDLSSLRVALNAAEPVRAGTIEAFERMFGLEAVMIAGYGLAEATVGVSAWRPGTPALVDESGTVSVGRPFPDVEVAILGGDRLLPAGERGEILVRSPANTRGYLGERGSAALFWGEGFLRTGDLGYLDPDGNLFVVGRLKQMVLQAGRNIAPREVEEIVDALPFVRRSAAIGVDRGDDAGEQLYVFAEIREGRRPQRALCRERVAAIVDRIHTHLGLRPGRAYLAAPRAIPLTPNGKVRYRELEERYRSGRLRRDERLWYPDW